MSNCSNIIQDQVTKQQVTSISKPSVTKHSNGYHHIKENNENVRQSPESYNENSIKLDNLYSSLHLKLK